MLWPSHRPSNGARGGRETWITATDISEIEFSRRLRSSAGGHLGPDTLVSFARRPRSSFSFIRRRRIRQAATSWTTRTASKRTPSRDRGLAAAAAAAAGPNFPLCRRACARGDADNSHWIHLLRRRHPGPRITTCVARIAPHPGGHMDRMSWIANNGRILGRGRDAAPGSLANHCIFQGPVGSGVGGNWTSGGIEGRPSPCRQSVACSWSVRQSAARRRPMRWLMYFVSVFDVSIPFGRSWHAAIRRLRADEENVIIHLRALRRRWRREEG